MQFEQDPGYFDDMGSLVVAEGDDLVERDKSGYLSGEELLSRRIPSETKTSYYLDRAEQEGTTGTIRGYPEPIAFELYLSKTESFWFGTTRMLEG